MRMTPSFLAILLAAAAMPVARAQDAAAPAVPTTQPTRITLKIDAPNTNEVARQLSEQLGVPVGVNRTTPRDFQYEAADKPFVSALGGFFEATGLSAGNYDQLNLVEGKPLKIVPVNDAMSLVVLRTSVSANRPLREGRSQINYNYSVQMALVADPALKLASVSQNINADEIEYDGTPFNRNNGYYSQRFGEGSGGVRAVWPVTFNVGSLKPATKIDRIAGTIRAWQVAEEATVEIDIADIANPRLVEGSGINATVNIDERRGRTNQLSITLTGPAAEMYADSRWQNVFRGAVTGVDIDQRPLVLQVSNVQGNPKDKSVKLDLYYQQFGPRRGMARNEDLLDRLETLRVRVPTKIRAIEIPVEVKDLPLP